MSGGEVFVFDVRICQSYQMTIAVTIRQPVTIGFYCVVANLPRGNFPPATTIRQSVMGLSQTGRGEERMVHSQDPPGVKLEYPGGDQRTGQWTVMKRNPGNASVMH